MLRWALSTLVFTMLLTAISANLRADSAQVVVSVRPLAMLVSELSEGLPISIYGLLPEGATPHDYALKPSDIKAMNRAALVVWLGPQSEPYLAKVVSKLQPALAWEQIPGLHSLPLRQAIHTGDDHSVDHNHHPHHDAQIDPHFWFSVDNAVVLVDALHQQLVALYPEAKAQLAANQRQLVQRLRQQVNQHRLGSNQQPQPFMLAHDAYAYLEHDLGLRSLATVVLDPELKPGARHIMALVDLVQKQGVACVITDPSVSTGLLNKIDPRHQLKQVPIDPMGWDFTGDRFSAWLLAVYAKMEKCVF